MTLDNLINTVHHMDALALMRSLPDASVQTVITSPPYYGLRDYGADGQIGLEPTPAAFVGKMVDLFREARRVLRDDGTLWLNLGDSYSAGGRGTSEHHSNFLGAGTAQSQAMGAKRTPGYGEKQLLGIPWRVAFGLQDDGWILRADLIWHKPNPMPESVTDRPTKAHEYVFLFSKQTRYYYDADAIREPAIYATDRRAGNGRFEYDGKHDGSQTQRAFVSIDPTGRNKRSVWTVPTQPFNGVATYGTYRIASRGCPVHDYQADEAHVLEYDARLTASQSAHNPDSDNSHAQVQEGAVVSIPLDQSASLFDASFAIPHSKRNYKTEDELERDVIFFGIPVDRTEYTTPIRRSVSKYVRTHESNTSVDAALDDLGCYPSAQTLYRTFGILTYQPPTPECTCYYTGKVEKRQDHFALFPPKLITPMILAGAPVGGVVLDPFMGSGTTALVARQLGRNFIGCDLNPEYVAMANRRLAQPHTPDMFYTLAAAE